MTFNKKICQSKVLAFSLILCFVLLITSEALPRKVTADSDKRFTPVVKVKEAREEISPAQQERFEQLIEEGRKLLQEEMDYEGAINKFKEAQDIAITREQKADAFFYLSLAHYATIEEKGAQGFNETATKLIEIDYYRELDKLLCPPRYVEMFEALKKEYGALTVLSNPPGADVYINESKDSAGKTPVTIGAKAGTVQVRVKKGKKEKRGTVRVAAGKETAVPTYVLKGGSGIIYVIGGIVLAGGVGAALLGGGGKESGGSAPATPTTGSIQVNSTPQGARIYLDGNDTGKTTNSTLTNVSPGAHRIKLTRQGYEDYERNVIVTAGQTVTVNATLTRIIIDEGYEFEKKWGSRGNGNYQFHNPHEVEIDNSGNLYIADTSNHRIMKFTSDGDFITKWGSKGTGNNQFDNPQGLAVDNSGNIYVADTANHRIMKFTPAGTFMAKFGSAGTGAYQFRFPSEIAVDDAGNIFVADSYNNRIMKYDSTGNFLANWGSQGSGNNQFNNPLNVTVDADGNVYVADRDNHRIMKFTNNGNYIGKWGSEGKGNYKFAGPNGVATDSEGNVYVCDTGNHRMIKFTSNGVYMLQWGISGTADGEFNAPHGIDIDSSGYAYVVEVGNNRLQKFRRLGGGQYFAKTKSSSLHNNLVNSNTIQRFKLLKAPKYREVFKDQRLLNRKNKKSIKK